MTDEELISALLSGNEHSVRVVRRWVRLSSSGFRRFLAHELEDLEQDILMQLIDALSQDRFSGTSRLETYVSRMVQYKCIDLLRTRGKRRWVDVEDLDLPAADTSAFERIRQQQGSELAVRVAASLSEACQRLWEMLHQGKSYTEMAQATGVSAGTLRVRVLRCRRKAVDVRDRLLALGDSDPSGLADGRSAP